VIIVTVIVIVIIAIVIAGLDCFNYLSSIIIDAWSMRNAEWTNRCGKPSEFGIE